MPAPKTVTRADHVRKAAKAHTDLNTFGSVISLIEGGHLYLSTSQGAARKIIAICRREMQSRLRDHDEALAKASAESL